MYRRKNNKSLITTGRSLLITTNLYIYIFFLFILHSKLTVLCLKCSYWEIAQYRLIYINGSKNAGSGVCHLVINMPLKTVLGHLLTVENQLLAIAHTFTKKNVSFCVPLWVYACVCIRVCLAVLKNCFHFRTSHLWWLKLWMTECFGDGLKHFSLLNTHI